jgi:hypothetical protein
MFQNFLFSVERVLPIFLIMFFGYFLRRKEITTDAFVKNGNLIVFRIALPATLFYNVYSQDVSQIFDIPFIIFTITFTLVCYGTTWLGGALLIRDKTVTSAFVHGAFRGNFVILGLPLMHSFIGIENSGKAALVILFTIPLYNILAIIILSVYSTSGERIHLKTILKAIATNPLTIGILIGLVLSVADIRLPAVLDDTVHNVAIMTTPLALICLGGGLELTKYNPKIKYSVWASILKTAVQPLAVTMLAYLFGFRSYDLAIIMIAFAVPAAVSSYAMTVQMGGDTYVGATSVIFSTFLSMFTLTLFIYSFVALGLV